MTRQVKMLTLLASPRGSVQPGQIATFDDEQAAQLVDGGYGIYADEPAAHQPTEVPLTSMTVPELRAYAAEHGVDLGGATRKADIIAALQAQDG